LAIGAGGARGRTQPRALIELFVMSRCPDARRAETRFNEVVHGIADVRTLYIAEPDAAGNVSCKHGAAECAGDAQQLCAARAGREACGASGAAGCDPFQAGWSFLTCQNERFADVGSLELADSCLQAAGFTDRQAARVRGCWAGPEGEQLLRASAAESRRRGASKSCTVHIGGRYRCTHDDDEWYDCPGGSEVSDFVASVCSEYQRQSGRWPEDVCGPEPAAGLEGAAVTA
ncbi:hypothetical protein TSOC_004630, partial [Tetrabaena socialis]